MTIANHHEFWRDVGEKLLSELQAFERSSYLDAGVKGRDGELAFRDWLTRCLPSRVSVLEGVIAGAQYLPSTQRDVVIFDSFNCPVFKKGYRTSEANVIPIEGVLGVIEVNSSNITKTKLQKDLNKLSSIKSVQMIVPPPQTHAFQIVNKEKPTGFLGKISSLEDGSHYQLIKEFFGRHQRFSYVFARDLGKGFNLEKSAKVLEEHNLKVGTDASVDGIFILRKGVILHRNDLGWQTTRTKGASIAMMPMEDWDVLLHLVSIVNQNVALGARGSMPAFEEYFAAPGISRKQVMQDKAHSISGEDYPQQESKYLLVQ